jgi:hypothetical protein
MTVFENDLWSLMLACPRIMLFRDSYSSVSCKACLFAMGVPTIELSSGMNRVMLFISVV